ncbi:unnamed protein product [Ceutorhynchus assimilis]|uniref:Insulin receptor substrate 1 n=1 Tax=Ceutorhynchus assimilis TaxID=467358 RepID=A0A9P0GRT3_9CUCU|nr:unnamed protein product [Ceutorhynchus assimilis]
MSSVGSLEATPSNNIIRTGVFKKLKTSRKKFFVLRNETSEALARLEYYDSEKKFRAGVPPKRSIPLRTCFNINKKQDSKHKFVIALYTKDDCFSIVFDNEEEMKVWLKDFLTLQHGEEILEGEILKPKFEYVWQVTLCERGLGAGRTGVYRLCLTDKTVTLVKIDEPIPTVIELSLASVRSCGNLKNFFFLEVGRMSEIGAGEIWFEADDTNIALNIQTTVSHRFKLARERSKTTSSTEPSSDLQPKGRHRSASATESAKNSKKDKPVKGSGIQAQDTSISESTLTTPVTATCSSTNNTGGGTNWSNLGNHQRTQSLPVTSAPATTTTTTTDNSSIYLTNHHQKKSQGAPGGGKCSFRERCDSMPTRPRTSSEGTHGNPSWGKPYLVPFRNNHLRDASHSPPIGSPMSPPSDSTGSSYSLPDEHDGHDIMEYRHYSTMTPEEVIAEEDYPESPRANNQSGDYLPMNFHNNYTEMSIGAASNSASMSSVTSGTPSADLRLADYPLDKVFSYVSADGDDTRPCRAYSVGSKPPDQLSSTPENARVRAFSVGSKTKKYFNRVLVPTTHHHIPGVKSSSAPLLLPNSRTGSSHGSINHNPMDDLMEMDFSSNGTSRSRSSTNASGSSANSCNHRNSSCNGTKGKFFGFLEHFGVSIGDKKHNNNTCNGYVEMKPGRTVSTDSPYVDMSQGQRLNHKDLTAMHDMAVAANSQPYYLDMSGNNPNNDVPLVGHPYSPYLDMSGSTTVKDNSPYMDMSGSNAAANVATRDQYMDMTGSSPVHASPRLNAITLHDYIKQFGRNPLGENYRHDYVDMNQQQRQRTNSNTTTSSKSSAMSPGAWTTDHSHDYLDMSGKNTTKRTNSFSSSPHFEATPFDPIPEGSARDTDGYVDMTPGDFQDQRRTSTDSDYLNMSGINLSSKNDKVRSQPIPIQTTAVKNSSPMTISSLLGATRKLSPPKMHLPLSSYSSLPRQKTSSRKSLQSQAGSSKDSSLSSSVTTTPSSSSTMFPMSLNSPTSPLSASSKPSSMKVPASVLNVPYKSNKKKPSEDYMMMDFDSKPVDDSAYVNYCPGPSQSMMRNSQSEGDYAVMKPGVFKSTTLPRVKTGMVSPGLASPLANVGLSDRQCFMPIREKDERMTSPKPGDVPEKTDDKSLETANMEFEDESRAYERLKSPAAKISRPNSSNSDQIKTGAVQRPASTTGSEKIASRPSSVCSEGLASRLGSNSSVYSSSSSTSTVVGVSTTNESEPQTPRLHYASLDLGESTSDGKALRTDPSDMVENQVTGTFVYADIDFVRSEELSKGPNAAATSAVKN